MDPSKREDTLIVKFWLLKNFSIVKGKSVTNEEILTKLVIEKENIGIVDIPGLREIGIVVLDLFGSEIKVQRKRSTKSDGTNIQFREYLNLCSVRYAPGEVQLNINQDLYGWILQTINQHTYTFIKVTPYFVNDNCCTIDLEICLLKKATSIRGINGIEIHETDINILKNDITESNLLFILYFLSKLKLCLGFTQSEKTEKVVRTQNDTLCSKLLVKGPTGKMENILSKKCQVFVNAAKSSSKSNCCSECSLVKKRLDHRKLEYAEIKITKNCLLGREELALKLKIIENEKRNAVKRERYWKNKFHNGSIPLDQEDCEDVNKMFESVDAATVPPGMQLLMAQQRKNLGVKGPSGRRWHPQIIKFCIDMYAASPKAYDCLKKNLILPSKRLICIYKNGIEGEAGWNPAVFEWLRREAIRLSLSDEDRWGGIMFDEMTIQEDVAFIKSGKLFKLAGCVNLGKSYENLKVLTTGKDEMELAKKVVQFALVTDSGFRFALAHFAITTMPAVTLGEKIWQGIEWTLKAGFRPYWLLFDGGEPNRSFLKMCLDENESDNFVAYNIKTGGPLVLMVDCKHNFKKIRNNILKSSATGKTPRHLVRNNKSILFSHWKSAYEWDAANHSLKLHEKLTHNHFDLDGRSKMRNGLAEDLLDDKMLYLMEAYQKYLATVPGKDPSELDGSIWLLQHTQELISLFSSKLPIESATDERIKKAKEFIRQLGEWESNAQSRKNFFSDQLWLDLKSMVYGLEQIVKIKKSKFPKSILKPIIINQDVLENVFCQIRGFNAQNDHPNYSLYMSTINTVNITQSSVSKKGNAGGSGDLPRVGLPNPHPFKKTTH